MNPATARDTPWLQRFAAHGALVAVWVVFVATASLDTGYQWDEWYHLQSVQMSVDRLELTRDDQHIYNGMYVLPGYVVLAWHAAPELPGVLGDIANNPALDFDPSRYPRIERWQTRMLRLLATNQYKAQVRLVFVLIAALGLPFVFLTVLRLYPGRYLAATAAAAFVGLSWEVSQRARSIEVDAPQMACVALQLYLVACALTARSRQAGLWTAVGLGASVGLSMGCKATGIYAVAPAVLAVCSTPLWRGLRERAQLLSAGAVSMIATLQLVSPHTLLDPLRVFHRAFSVALDYESASASQPNYVDGPLEHLGVVFRWLLLAVPSANVLLSAVLSGVVGLGCFALVRRRGRFALIAAVLPVLLLGTLCQLDLLQLRNYTQLIPLPAVAFGAGVVWLSKATSSRPWLARGLLSGLVGSVAFNAGWLVYADHSVRTSTPAAILDDVRDHLDAEQADVIVSPRLHRKLGPFLTERFTCSPNDRAERPVLMYFTDHHPWRWKMYRIGFIERYFGPLDHNPDWYTVSKGRLEHHRIVLLPAASAREMKVATDSMLRCRKL